MKITTGSFLGYTVMPRFLPLLKNLLTSGFHHVSYYTALVLGTVRLFPANHAYLNPQNIGRFGIANVLIEAGRNLVFDRKHADQVTMYVLVVLGLVLFVAQFFLLGFSLFTQFAHAGNAAATYAAFVTTQQPLNDIAFIMMDRVFGIPGFFGSCVSTGAICLNGTLPEGQFPAPYHAALHSMLQFYSMGVAVIGLLIFMYYMVAIIVETAQTGVPFGRRFNSVWAPIRMVVALGLLIPLTYGLNGAQLLTLNVAKWGSGFATNGWNLFVATLVAGGNVTITGVPTEQLVAEPKKPDTQSLAQFFTVASVCRKAYAHFYGINIDAYLVLPAPAADSFHRLLDDDWAAALFYYDNGSINVVFGEQSAAAHRNEKGYVKPYCGELVLNTIDIQNAGARSLQQSYYEGLIRRPWNNIMTGAGITGAPALPNGRQQDFFNNAGDRILEYMETFNVPDNQKPTEAAKAAIRTQFELDTTQYIQAAIQAHINDPQWLAQLNGLGWGGAGIWYNRIAEMNGSLYEAAASIPVIKRWPQIMEDVANEKSKKDRNVPADKKFDLKLSNGVLVEIPDGGLPAIAEILNEAYKLWSVTDSNPTTGAGQSTNKVMTGSVLTDVVNFIFGTEGLFSMRDNADIYPLAQLTALGKHLLYTSIRNISIGAGAGLGGFIEKKINIPRQFVEAISSMAMTFGMMTLALGFVLYYVVPFLPFIYFFFQVGGWIKALFEAMVGLPLWALSHIRIDGNGLPGQAAMNGYFLILEIFLRPVLTIFGLLAGIAIFAAQVQVLNTTFDLVVENLTGFDAEGATAADPGAFAVARAGIDYLFYTVIYVVIVYMMATSSFKLVYMIPDNMLRWMNSSVDGFGEIARDSPESLVGTMYLGVGAASRQFSGVTSALMTGGGGGGGGRR